LIYLNLSIWFYQFNRNYYKMFILKIILFIVIIILRIIYVLFERRRVKLYMHFVYPIWLVLLSNLYYFTDMLFLLFVFIIIGIQLSMIFLWSIFIYIEKWIDKKNNKDISKFSVFLLYWKEHKRKIILFINIILFFLISVVIYLKY
jgi:hypothetical protein